MPGGDACTTGGGGIALILNCLGLLSEKSTWRRMWSWTPCSCQQMSRREGNSPRMFVERCSTSTTEPPSTPVKYQSSHPSSPASFSSKPSSSEGCVSSDGKTKKLRNHSQMTESIFRESDGQVAVQATPPGRTRNRFGCYFVWQLLRQHDTLGSWQRALQNQFQVTHSTSTHQ